MTGLSTRVASVVSLQLAYPLLMIDCVATPDCEGET